MTASITRLSEFESRAELERYLRNIDGITLLVGSDAESPRKFYAHLTGESAVKAIGIICSFHGIKPVVLPWASGGMFLVGHDCTITGIDSSSGRVKFSVLLNG